MVVKVVKRYAYDVQFSISLIAWPLVSPCCLQGVFDDALLPLHSAVTQFSTATTTKILPKNKRGLVTS